MKDIIKNYYGFVGNDIYFKDNIYYFSYNNINFMFIQIDNYDINLEKIYNINSNLYLNSINMNQIYINLLGNYETIIDNKKYVMFYTYINNRETNIYDILKFNNQNHISNYKNNWHDLWCKKIDYYEYQMNQFGNKYPLLRESFSYVVGLAELSISLINNIDLNNTYNCYMHKRIDNYILNYYCPLNIIIDSRVRDISEYVKNSFFYDNKNIINDFEIYLKTVKLTNEEYKLLLVRLLFITPYFDLYENIMDETREEKEIKKIIQKLNDYEKFLKKYYKMIYKNINMIEIPFLLSN